MGNRVSYPIHIKEMAIQAKKREYSCKNNYGKFLC